MKPLGAGDLRSIGEYQLVGFLGQGGMGQVYLGKSPEGMLVAVKVISPEWTQEPSFRDRFRREMQAVARVGGGYVADLLSCDPNARQPWLATRFILGVTLADVVWPRDREGRQLPARPLPAGGLWWLAFGLIKALQAIHACNIVHRDLKPGNVMLSSFGPRVIDFGVASGLAGSGLSYSSITIPGFAVGTPDYMSPEQRLGLPVGTASDVYSLGAVLTAAATGSVPERDSLERPRWDCGLAAVPPDLRPLIGSCLEPRPEDRPKLNELLSAALHGREPYPRAMPSHWPQPTATLVETEAGRVFDFLAAAGCLPSVTDHNGWEQWYLPHEHVPSVPPVPPAPPDTIDITEPRVRLALRPGLDGVFFAAYRSYRSGRSGGMSGGGAGWQLGQQLSAGDYALLGDRHRERGRHQDAVDAYQASLKLDPKNAVVWNDLGRTLSAKGLMRPAERAFAQAIENSEHLVAVLRNRYLAIYQMGGGMHTAQLVGEQLEDVCQAVIRRSPADAAAYCNLGDAYCTLGDGVRGAAAYREALRLDQDNPRLLERLRYTTGNTPGRR
jgi:serine/threonine protein kinase